MANMSRLYLIEILHQTTTLAMSFRNTWALYLIEILHQTTTQWLALTPNLQLYLIEILHQTTTLRIIGLLLLSCILLKFYIKPQLSGAGIIRGGSCILLKFYIKPQRSCPRC